MEIKTDNHIEIVKLLVDRQKYMTDLAKDIFNYFTKMFVTLSAGAFAAISLQKKLTISKEVLEKVFTGIAVLVTVVGIVAIMQIVILLIRWYQYRRLEVKLSGLEDLKPEWWASIFELMFGLSILASIIIIWLGKDVLLSVL